jgi:hypothetical protein
MTFSKKIWSKAGKGTVIEKGRGRLRSSLQNKNCGTPQGKMANRRSGEAVVLGIL